MQLSRLAKTLFKYTEDPLLDVSERAVLPCQDAIILKSLFLTNPNERSRLVIKLSKQHTENLVLDISERAFLSRHDTK